MAQEVAEAALAEPLLGSEEWVQARMAQFSADPAMRDRALAMVLMNSLMLAQGLGAMTEAVRKEGIGGLLKAAMSGGKKNGG